MKFFVSVIVFVVLATSGSYALTCYNCRAGNVDTCNTGSAACGGPEAEQRCARAVGYTEDGAVYGVLEGCASATVCANPDAVCAAAKKAYPAVKTCKMGCCSDDNCLAPITLVA